MHTATAPPPASADGRRALTEGNMREILGELREVHASR
jgi:hypothetical protein